MSSTSGYESSEGTAELIERLIVTCLKHAAATTPEAAYCLEGARGRIESDIARRLGLTIVMQLRTVIGDCVSVGGSLRVAGLESQVGPEATQLVVELCEANRLLYRLKDEQAAAVMGDEYDAEVLVGLIRRDLALCRMRAEVRAKLNVALGGQSSGESVKNYGG